MRESVRLAYLEAMGVTGWVPAMALAHAARRAPPEPEELVVLAPDVAPVAQPENSPATAAPVVSPVATGLVRPELPRVKSAVSVPRSEPQPEPEVVAVEQPVPEAQAVAPFYLQLWLAGPCALLIEIADPGLEKGTPEYHLLADILRAAGLPTTPRLYADFRWPLSRNPQVARSAAAASEALQVFMQARLEQNPAVSIGCFGPRSGLLAESNPELAAELCGREEALDELGPAWFAADLQTLMRTPEEKAKLWQLLQRVMPRWQGSA